MWGNVFFLLWELVESERSIMCKHIGMRHRDKRTRGSKVRGCLVSPQLLSLKFPPFLGAECPLSLWNL